MDAEHYFQPDQSPQNQVRFCLWQIMDHYSQLDIAWKNVVNFEWSEEEGKDLAEEIIIEMEKHHKKIAIALDVITNGMDDQAYREFKDTQIGEALRRTDLFLSQLNKLDLTSSTWLITLSRCIVDLNYHNQIKALIYPR